MTDSGENEKRKNYNSEINTNSIQHSLFPPPPPLYRSLLPAADNEQFPNKGQTDHNSSSASSTITTNVKGYISRLNATISPIYSTFIYTSGLPSALTVNELHESVRRNSSNNYIAKSEILTERFSIKNHSIPKSSLPQSNNRIQNIMENRPSTSSIMDNGLAGGGSMSESLERIGTSLQRLIEEAQTSLLNPKHQGQCHHEDDLIADGSKGISGYSYHYIQSRYTLSQAKLALALDQLEKSIQYIPTMMMTSSHEFKTQQQHYYHHATSTSKGAVFNYNNDPAKTPKRNFKVPWATLGLVISLLIYSLRRPKTISKYEHIPVPLILLLISSFYRRLGIKHHFPTMNSIDLCVLRFNLSKGTPAICGFIHRLNIVLCLLLHK